MEPEDTLRRSEALSRAFLASASESIVATDATGRIVLLNARAETMFGYTRAELIGQPVELLIPKRTRSNPSGDRSGRDLVPSTGPGEAAMYVARWATWRSRRLEVSLSFVQTDEGTSAIAFITDISERVALQRAARQAEAGRHRARPLDQPRHRPRTPRHRGCQFRGGEGHDLHPDLPARRLRWLIL